MKASGAVAASETQTMRADPIRVESQGVNAAPMVAMSSTTSAST